jgi:hypothetical protein
VLVVRQRLDVAFLGKIDQLGVDSRPNLLGISAIESA